MKYRALSASGDYTIKVPFLVNSSACVAQAVRTRLLLLKGEWYLDTTDGTPYLQSILGKHFGSNPNAFVKQRMLGTPGVLSIAAYTSSYDNSMRKFTVTATLNTIYGLTTVTV